MHCTSTCTCCGATVSPPAAAADDVTDGGPPRDAPGGAPIEADREGFLRMPKDLLEVMLLPGMLGMSALTSQASLMRLPMLGGAEVVLSGLSTVPMLRV